MWGETASAARATPGRSASSRSAASPASTPAAASDPTAAPASTATLAATVRYSQSASIQNLFGREVFWAKIVNLHFSHNR